VSYTLGLRSRLELRGVHPSLVAVVHRAIAITSQDFRVLDGLREIEEQQELVKRGASKTLRSMHLRQPDGWGHAVDLVPVVNGVLRWEWPLIYPVARAMRVAAEAGNVPLVWGGCWDMPFLSLHPDGLEAAVRVYCARHPGPDFLDGPHYQLGQP